jgi:aldose 1-epimerase
MPTVTTTLHSKGSVSSIRLGGEDDLVAEILTFGGIIREMSIPTRSGRKNLIVSLPSVEDYEADPAYIGATIGRCCNRISSGVFHIGSAKHQLSLNEGKHHLHGGVTGFSKRHWRILGVSRAPSPRVWLGLHSIDGDDGYPGDLDVISMFEALPNALKVRVEARANQETLVNLTLHPYFNLSGAPELPASRQLLAINAGRYLPVDRDLIPAGDTVSVAGTPFDFRGCRPIVSAGLHPQLEICGGFDHAFVLDRPAAAVLQSPDSGVRMALTTNQPTLQFYDGRKLPIHKDRRRSGVCLEPQLHPNGINTAGFPSALLKPEEVYVSETTFEFSL